jgi:hypothetical protein
MSGVLYYHHDVEHNVSDPFSVDFAITQKRSSRKLLLILKIIYRSRELKV